MPTFNTNAIFSLQGDGRLNGQQILLTTHWKVTQMSPAGPYDLFQFFTDWHTANELFGGITGLLANVYSNEVSTIRWIYQMIHPTRYIRVFKATVNDTGTQVENSSPPNVATVITVRSDLTGRTQRGNKHLGGVPVTFTEDGLTSAAGLVEYNLLLAGLASPLEVVGAEGTVELTPLIFHRAAPASSVGVTNGDVQLTTRVERRRTVGLGS